MLTIDRLRQKCQALRLRPRSAGTFLRALLLHREAAEHRAAGRRLASRRAQLQPSGGPDAFFAAAQRAARTHLTDRARREEIAARACRRDARRAATWRIQYEAELFAIRTAGQPFELEAGDLGGMPSAQPGPVEAAAAPEALPVPATRAADGEWEAEVLEARRIADDLAQRLRTGRGER